MPEANTRVRYFLSSVLRGGIFLAAGLLMALEFQTLPLGAGALMLISGPVFAYGLSVPFIDRRPYKKAFLFSEPIVLFLTMALLAFSFQSPYFLLAVLAYLLYAVFACFYLIKPSPEGTKVFLLGEKTRLRSFKLAAYYALLAYREALIEGKEPSFLYEEGTLALVDPYGRDFGGEAGRLYSKAVPYLYELSDYQKEDEDIAALYRYLLKASKDLTAETPDGEIKEALSGEEAKATYARYRLMVYLSPLFFALPVLLFVIVLISFGYFSHWVLIIWEVIVWIGFPFFLLYEGTLALRLHAFCYQEGDLTPRISRPVRILVSLLPLILEVLSFASIFALGDYRLMFLLPISLFLLSLLSFLLWFLGRRYLLGKGERSGEAEKPVANALPKASENP